MILTFPEQRGWGWGRNTLTKPHLALLAVPDSHQLRDPPAQSLMTAWPLHPRSDPGQNWNPTARCSCVPTSWGSPCPSEGAEREEDRDGARVGGGSVQWLATHTHTKAKGQGPAACRELAVSRLVIGFSSLRSSGACFVLFSEVTVLCSLQGSETSK